MESIAFNCAAIWVLLVKPHHAPLYSIKYAFIPPASQYTSHFQYIDFSGGSQHAGLIHLKSHLEGIVHLNKNVTEGTISDEDKMYMHYVGKWWQVK